MANIYKSIDFNKKLKNLNEENNFFLSDKKKKVKSFSYNMTPLIKQKINYDSLEILKGPKQNNFNDNNQFKHSLFLKKINLKERKNKYYIEGVYKLFNDENVFLENIYKGRKIVIGKSRNKSSINSHLNYRKHNKTNTKKGNLVNPKSKMSSSNILNNTRSFNQYNNNTFISDSAMQGSKGRKMAMFVKKNDNYITDDELKNIYQECNNREKKGFKKAVLKLKNKSFVYHKYNKSPEDKEINNILNLQSSILNKYKLRNNETNKMVNKLLNNTSKRRYNKLLINQINDYRLKKEKIDEEDINYIIKKNPNFKNNKIKEVEKKLQWLSSLREYQIDSKNNMNRCMSSKNKDLTSYYSFDKRDILYDLCGKIHPLYAQITPKIYKDKEKIRDTLNEIINQKILQINKNPNINKTLIGNKNRLNLYNGLNIKGTKLINFEIELSKELEGKKKKIIQFPYRDEEITTKFFAKSYSHNNFYAPKSVKNAVELHYNPK